MSESSVEPPIEFGITVTDCGEVEYAYDWSDEAAGDRFDAWRLSACPHDGFEIARDHLSNVFGMAELRSAAHGIRGLSILQNRLPTANGGCIPADEVARAIQELGRLRSASAGAPLHRMIDSDSGEVLRELTMSEDGVFAVHGDHGVEMGFDGRGFFILLDLAPRPAPIEIPRGPNVHFIPNDALPPTHEADLLEVFRAQRVEQVLDGPINGRDQPVILIDLDSGTTFRSPCAMRHLGRGFALEWTGSQGDARADRIPDHFHVDTVPRPDDWFDYILTPLRSLLDLALEHRTSLVWT